ncbi:MAG TPA: hypothetical protein VMA35_09255 [Candidatus Sulfopaludibacter sp.]|nr:hypothetical protein [Candidatus Sulfopaludibacter sp.]
MKTKIILLAALIGAAALSANAGVRFGVSFGFPLPVVVSPPVVYATPVAPAPVTVVQTVPSCPGVDYVWVAGYWSYLPTGRVWVPGAWHYRPARVAYRYDRYDGHNRDGYHR